MKAHRGGVVPGSVAHWALQYLKQCGDHGALMADVVAHGRAPVAAVQAAIWRLVRIGLATTRRDPGPAPQHNRLRYFVATSAPAQWVVPTPQPRPPKPAPTRSARDLPLAAWPKKSSATAGGVSRHRAIRLDPEAPAIVPRGVRITVCPCGTDTRFTVKPGERIQGAGFVDEWRRLRGARP